MEDDSPALLRVSDVVQLRFRHLFKHAHFNHMQSAILDQALNSEANMVVAAPTGSGKTVIHELAVVRLLFQDVKHPKTVFVAPNKALCQQRMREWEEKFKPLGQTVLEVTGDIDLKQCLRLIAMANIIITTPEKWDSLTRVWKDHVFLLGSINLLLIDEVHHLGEDRGATLEALVVRMRMLSTVYQEKLTKGSKTVYHRMRVIALSATLPNLADIGEWLGCSHDAIHYFDESFRPVPLRVHTLSMGSMNNPFLFDKSLDERVGPLILSYSEGKQVLVFCASKKGTETLCTTLTQRIQIPREALNKARACADLISTAHDDNLRYLLSKGVAYHHSGLPADDRALVEQLYLSGVVHILCCTSTLAHGVNLPAHLVVIKGTSSWRGGSRGYERTSKADIIQMLGRAGRPGMDDRGVAVIMTSREDQDFYADVSLSAEVVESKLQNNLVEAICAEITQTVIISIADCINWMKSTFFYVRVRKNPTKYGFEQFADAAQLEDLLCNLCTAAIGDLAGAGLIGFDQATKQITAQPEALIMTRSMSKFQTMELLVNIPAEATIAQVLHALCLSNELDKPVRRLEKRLLNDMMKSVRYPLKTRVQDPSHKSYVLLQAAVARVDIKDFSLRVEQAEIVECALRVLGALRELAVQRELGPLLESTVLLDRALRTRMWESNYGSVFQQCPGLSTTTSNSLTLRGVRNLGDVEGCGVNRVQDMIGGTQAESRAVLMFAKTLQAANREVSAVMENQQLVIRVAPTYTPATTDGASECSVDSSFPMYQLIAYEVTTSKALCIRTIERGAKHAEFRVPAAQVKSVGDVKCCLLSNYVGIDSFQQAANQLAAATMTTTAVPPTVTAPGSVPSNRRTAAQPTNDPSPTLKVTQKATKAPKAAKTVVDNSMYPTYGRKEDVAPAVASPARSTQPGVGSLHAYFPSHSAVSMSAVTASESPAVSKTHAAPMQVQPPHQPAPAGNSAPAPQRVNHPPSSPVPATHRDHNVFQEYAHNPHNDTHHTQAAHTTNAKASSAAPHQDSDYYTQFDLDFSDFSVPAKIAPWQPPPAATAQYQRTKAHPSAFSSSAAGALDRKTSPNQAYKSSPAKRASGNSSGGGVVGMVRRKAAELELDRIPVQRLRTNHARWNELVERPSIPQPHMQVDPPELAGAVTQQTEAQYEYNVHPHNQHGYQHDPWSSDVNSAYTSFKNVPMVTPSPTVRPQASRKRFFDESDVVIPLSQEFDFCPPHLPPPPPPAPQPYQYQYQYQYLHQPQPLHTTQPAHPTHQALLSPQHPHAPQPTSVRYPQDAAGIPADASAHSYTTGCEGGAHGSQVGPTWHSPKGKENSAPTPAVGRRAHHATATAHNTYGGDQDRGTAVCAVPPSGAGVASVKASRSAMPSLPPQKIAKQETDDFDSIFF